MRRKYNQCIFVWSYDFGHAISVIIIVIVWHTKADLTELVTKLLHTSTRTMSRRSFNHSPRWLRSVQFDTWSTQSIIVFIFLTYFKKWDIMFVKNAYIHLYICMWPITSSIVNWLPNLSLFFHNMFVFEISGYNKWSFMWMEKWTK